MSYLLYMRAQPRTALLVIVNFKETLGFGQEVSSFINYVNNC